MKVFPFNVRNSCVAGRNSRKASDIYKNDICFSLLFFAVKTSWLLKFIKNINLPRAPKHDAASWFEVNWSCDPICYERQSLRAKKVLPLHFAIFLHNDTSEKPSQESAGNLVAKCFLKFWRVR